MFVVICILEQWICDTTQNSFWERKKSTNLKKVFFFIAKMHMQFHVIELKIQHWNERAWKEWNRQWSNNNNNTKFLLKLHTNDAKCHLFWFDVWWVWNMYSTPSFSSPLPSFILLFFVVNKICNWCIFLLCDMIIKSRPVSSCVAFMCVFDWLWFHWNGIHITHTVYFKCNVINCIYTVLWLDTLKTITSHEFQCIHRSTHNELNSSQRWICCTRSFIILILFVYLLGSFTVFVNCKFVVWIPFFFSDRNFYLTLDKCRFILFSTFCYSFRARHELVSGIA